MYRPAPPPTTPPEPSIIAEGKIDNFGSWTLDENSLLTIDGRGDMPNWSRQKEAPASPWGSVYEKIKSISISDSVTSIGEDAFDRCSNLHEITIPNSVVRVGRNAFRNCTSLTKVDIPNHISEIDNGTFSGCISLTQITIPNSITRIGAFAFFECKSLRHISIPYGIRKIGA